jgi:hypothetical protein
VHKPSRGSDSEGKSRIGKAHATDRRQNKNQKQAQEQLAVGVFRLTRDAGNATKQPQ